MDVSFIIFCVYMQLLNATFLIQTDYWQDIDAKVCIQGASQKLQRYTDSPENCMLD